MPLQDVIYINASHVLSRFYSFEPPLQIIDDGSPLMFPSVEHIRWYLSLLQSGFVDAAVKFSEIPCQSSHCEQWVEQNGCYITPTWIVCAKELYSAIIIDQLGQPSSPLRTAWEMILADTAKTSSSRLPPRFVVLSGSKENIWSGGLGRTAAERTMGAELRGQNLYGRILNRIALGPPSCCWDVSSLASIREVDPNPFPFRRTLLVISDSVCRNIKHIDGGTVMAISGAKFTDLLAVGNSATLAKYGIIIVNGGVNVARRKASWEVQLAALRRLIRRMLKLNPRPHVVVSGPMPLPGARGVQELDAIMREQMQMLEVQYIGWTSMDTPPFEVEEGGKMKPKNIDRDGFHLSIDGTWQVIEHWKSEYPLMESISFSLVDRRYPLDIRARKRSLPFAGTRKATPPVGGDRSAWPGVSGKSRSSTICHETQRFS